MDITFSYFQELKNKKDLFLTIFLGLVFGLFTFNLERANYYLNDPSFNWIQPSLDMLFDALIAFTYIGIIIRIKNKTIMHSDSLLFALMGFTLIKTILYVTYPDVFKTVINAILFVLGLFIVICRNNYVCENSKDVSIKSYHSLVARKYDYFLILLLAFSLSYIFVYFIEAKTLFKDGLIYSIFSLFLAFNLVTTIFTLARGKKSKVSYIDAILKFEEYLLLFSFLIRYLFNDISDKTPIVNNYVMDQHLLFFLWAISLFTTIITIAIRSSFASLHVSCDYKGKSTSNYFGALFSKYHHSYLLFMGAMIFIDMNYMLDIESAQGGIIYKNVFKFSLDSTIRIPMFLNIIIFIIIGIMALYGLLKRGFLKREVNLFDASLFTLLIALLGCSFMFTNVKLNLLRGVFVFLPLLIVCGLIGFRIYQVDLLKQEEIHDDETVFHFKIVSKKNNIIENEVEVSESTPVIEVENTKENELETNQEENNNQLEDTNPKEDELETKEDEEEESKESSKEGNIDNPFAFNSNIKTMEEKIDLLSEEQKAYYDELKNYLLSFDFKDRILKKEETFRKKNLLFKIVIAGKSIRLHLPLKCAEFDVKRYHQKNYEEVKRFKEVPFGIVIRNKLNLKRAKELIDIALNNENK